MVFVSSIRIDYKGTIEDRSVNTELFLGDKRRFGGLELCDKKGNIITLVVALLVVI